MRAAVLAILVFFLLFGVKIGIVDLSVLVPLFLLPFLLGREFRLPAGFAQFGFWIALLLCYQMCVQAINGDSSFEVSGRLVRSLAMTGVVGLLVGEQSDEEARQLFRVVVFTLLAHSVLVIVAANFMPLNRVLGMLTGNDRVRDLRASGLVSGFDMAGVLSIIGCALVIADPFREIRSPLLSCAMCAICAVACFFASRVSVAICGLLLLYQLGRVLVDHNISRGLRVGIAVSLLWPVYFFGKQVLQIIDVSVSLGIFDADADTTAAVAARFAVQDPDSFLWEDMLFLPRTINQLLFGAGIDPFNSDVGYVKEIFRYGAVGLALALGAHWAFYRNVVRTIRTPDARSARRLLVFLFGLGLMLSWKNNYVFVRGFFPTLLLICGSVGCRVLAVRSQALNMDEGRRDNALSYT